MDARLLIVVAMLVAHVVAARNVARAQLKAPVLFDFGTDESPVVRSAVRVTGADAYRAAAGFGWTTTEHHAFDRDRPLAELRHGGNPMRPDLLYQSHATPMTRDGVASKADMRFRIDVKPGKYRVHVWMGDLHHALESLALECNGRTIATGVSAKHIIGRSQPESTGLYQILRFDADAPDGRIELRFFGDDSQYQEASRRLSEWFPPGARVDSYLGSGFDPERKLKFDPKGAFRQNSVLAVRVATLQDPLIQWNGARLTTTDRGGDVGRRFVSAFNQGKLARAESVLNSDDVSRRLLIRGTLGLLGHPGIEGQDEERLVAKAEELVAAAVSSESPDVWAVEAQTSLSIFIRARRHFLQRGMAEEGHFQENRKAVSLMRLILPDDLLYWKALEYQGRALQMLDPHRWVYPSGDAQVVWQELIAAFPENRYARFYLKDEWDSDDVWNHGDHLPAVEDAPEWALAQREAWGLLLEMCEWWAANKRHADGSIGGGWGDDVELVALFGLMGFISEDASPPSVNLARKLVDGLWRHGGIDRDNGFYRGLLDAEHSAEWTGDTLPLMLTIDWGNPIWVERSMQTARLMRDLWMDYNEQGDLHFKSNFLGSISVGNDQQANDSYINYRAALPAVSVYRYNRHPEIASLLVEWSDAWLANAMRTDRGKPRGVFSAEVGFPSGEIGGVNSPNWYTSAHPPGTINYDWQDGAYEGYLVSLMLLGHEITGDGKYLEPFLLQKQLVDQYRADPVDSPLIGSPMWAAKILSEGSSRRRRPFDEIWRQVSAARSPSTAGDPPVLIERDEVHERMNSVRRLAKQRWPVLTTETSATDRVGFRGIADPFFIMTGTRDFHPAVTYSGVHRDFAAYVRQADHRYLNLAMYNFAEAETEADVTPWKLEVGGTYRLLSGVDTDGDGRPDRDVYEASIKLDQRGRRVRFPFAPRETTVVELRQVEAGRGTQPYADLAVVSSEIKYSIWTRDLQISIHNVGTQSARQFKVTVYEGEGSNRQPLGERTVPHLSWPKNFQQQQVTIGIPFVPSRSHVRITVVVDEPDAIRTSVKTVRG